MKGFIIYTFTFCVICGASPRRESIDEEHPIKCQYDNDKNEVLANGARVKVEGECAVVKCTEDFQIIKESCKPLNRVPEKCTVIQYKEYTYPFCCPVIVCLNLNGNSGWPV